jgi:hypothetical protein
VKREQVSICESEERRTSDYKDWLSSGGIKPFPDLIPGLGFITQTERIRKKEGKSFKDFYIKESFDWRQILTLGTHDWPESNDNKAELRAGALAVRNVSLAFYHTAGTFFACEGIYHGAKKLIEYISTL